ncbi:MAG: glycyl-radical enzyme activating protein, partial [Promethearchaeota archaeon]
DIKIIDNKEHQKYTGVSNNQILSNFKKLLEEGKHIILRFPVIPGITDTEENISQMEEWLKQLPLDNLREINLLPFHKIGQSKYKKLSRVNQLTKLKSPSSERLNQLLERFRALGFNVKIGG